MRRMINIQARKRLWYQLTWILLTFILADAAYILALVQKMTENISLAAELYHTVPTMTEHVLCAVVLYLGCMILASKSMDLQ